MESFLYTAMPTKKIKYFALLIFVASLFGCSEGVTRTYTYDVMENVKYTLNANNLEYKSDIKSVFLYFELVIENNSNQEIYLDVGKIKASLNGELSTGTWYDSLASNLPIKEKLKKGRTKLKLYFVYPESLKGVDFNDFKVVNNGLSEA